MLQGLSPKNINSKTKFFDDEEYTENLVQKRINFTLTYIQALIFRL